MVANIIAIIWLRKQFLWNILPVKLMLYQCFSLFEMLCAVVKADTALPSAAMVFGAETYQLSQLISGVVSLLRICCGQCIKKDVNIRCSAVVLDKYCCYWVSASKLEWSTCWMCNATVTAVRIF